MTESSIAVAVRSRPLLIGEVPHPQPMTFNTGNPPSINFLNKNFNYDYVFTPNISNKKVYDAAVAPKIPNLFEGYNVTILAYGSTGSGKTYTMGTDFKQDCSDVGLIPLCLKEIFNVINNKKDEKKFKVTVSFIELYMEKIHDLCATESSLLQFQEKEPFIQEHKDGCRVINISEQEVTNLEEALAILQKGSRARQTSETAKNLKSSRSHALFTVHVEQTDNNTYDTKLAKFQLVDLAGSERLDTSKLIGKQLREGKLINLSLLTLSKVILALSEKKTHVPFRESKVTRILQDSLGGSSYTIMISCVNPTASSGEQTLSTLRYSDNARNIKNKPKVNVETSDEKIKRLQDQVNYLQDQLYNKRKSICGSTYDNKASALVKKAYLDKTSLNEKIMELEEEKKAMKQRIESIYKTIQAAIVDIMPFAITNEDLKASLNKLEELQSECIQLLLMEESNHESPEANTSANDQPSVEELECEELTFNKTSEMSTDEGKSESELIEELDGIAEQQKTSENHLQNVQLQLKVKENLARFLDSAASDYSNVEVQGNVLEQKIIELNKEKNNLLTLMEQEKQDVKENSDKIKKYEKEIKDLQDELRKVKKDLQLKMFQKGQFEKLQQEIKDLKRLRVDVIKKMKENNSKFIQKDRQKEKDIAQLKKDQRKKEHAMNKERTLYLNKIRFLETKTKKLEQRSIQILQRKNLQTNSKSKQSQVNIEEMVEDEIKEHVSNSLAKLEIEILEKEVENLREQIKKLEEFPSDEAIDIDELEAAFQVHLERIDNLKNQIKNADQKTKTCIIIDELPELSARAKTTVEAIYNKCVAARVEVEKQALFAEEYQKKQVATNEEDIKNMAAKIKQLENELNKEKYNNQQASTKYEAEVMKLMTDFQTQCNSTFQVAASNFTESLDTKDSEELENYKENYKRKCDELNEIQQELFEMKKGKKGKWLSSLMKDKEKPKDATFVAGSERSMMEEFLSSEDEASFSNDANDPDFRLTPLYKQVKRRRDNKENPPQPAKRMASSNLIDSVESMDTSENEVPPTPYVQPANVPCKCIGECKTNRCKCKKRKIVCSEACSCITTKCLNVDPYN